MKKHLLFLLVALFAFGTTAMAQEQQRQGNRQGFDPKTRAEQMAKSLELSAEQQAKVEALFTTQQKESTELREKMQNDREGMRTKMQEMRTKWDGDLEKIIGKEKMEKYRAQQQERMRQRQENRPAQN